MHCWVWLRMRLQSFTKVKLHFTHSLLAPWEYISISPSWSFSGWQPPKMSLYFLSSQVRQVWNKDSSMSLYRVLFLTKSVPCVSRFPSFHKLSDHNPIAYCKCGQGSISMLESQQLNRIQKVYLLQCFMHLNTYVFCLRANACILHTRKGWRPCLLKHDPTIMSQWYFTPHLSLTLNSVAIHIMVCEHKTHKRTIEGCLRWMCLSSKV